MDAKSRRAYYLTWGISWVILSGLLALFVWRPGADLFLDPGTWLATFPVAWTIALLSDGSRQLRATRPEPQKKGRSLAWLIPLSNPIIQLLANHHLMKNPDYREWIFVGALSLFGFILCLVQLRKIRTASRQTARVAP